jgi:hypothetical protein
MIASLGALIGPVILFGGSLYFLPTIIGGFRRVVNIGSVFAINLLLGWTLIGWAVALAMALRTNPPSAHPQFRQPSAPVPVTSLRRPTASGALDSVERLAALRAQGALSETEFQRLKAEALRSEPETPEDERRRPWLLWAVLAAAVLTAAVVVPVVTNGPPAKAKASFVLPSAGSSNSSRSASTPKTTPSTSASVNVTVPLVTCPTTYGVFPPTPAPLPSSITVSAPSDLAGQLAVYTDQQGTVKLVGPKGWQCSASYGADGSGVVRVYPTGEQEPTGSAFSPQQQEAIVGSETSACEGCREFQACPLFSAAASDYSTDYGMSCPETRPTEESTDQISTGVIGFEDPAGVAGDGNPSGGPYPANGVMTYYSANEDGSWLDTCTLPNSEHALCTVALNSFVSLYGND